METLCPVSQTVDSSPHLVATLSMSQQPASAIISASSSRKTRIDFQFKNKIVTITMQHLSRCHNEESSINSQQIKYIIKYSYNNNAVSMMLLGY